MRNKGEKIGQMDTLITIERLTLIENAYAERVPQWEAHTTAWAEVQHQSARKDEEINEGLNLATSPVNFIIRTTDVTVKDRILHDGKYFDIINVANIGRNDRLLITAQNVE